MTSLLGALRPPPYAPLDSGPTLPFGPRHNLFILLSAPREALVRELAQTHMCTSPRAHTLKTNAPKTYKGARALVCIFVYAHMPSAREMEVGGWLEEARQTAWSPASVGVRVCWLAGWLAGLRKHTNKTWSAQIKNSTGKRLNITTA